MTVRELFVSLGISKDEASFNEAEASIKGLAGTAAKLLGAIGIGLSLKAMNSLAEEFNNVNDSIRGATREMGDQAEIQQKILAAAQDTKMTYAAMASNVTQLIKMNDKVFDSVDTATNFATLFTKNLEGAGRSASEVSSAMSYMNRVLAKGNLDTATYERMLRQYPEVLNTIAEGMGVTKEELRKMAATSTVTSQKIVDAYTAAADSIQSSYDELDYSISDALTNIRNSWGLFCDDLWTGSNITNGVGTMMVKTFNKILTVLKKIQPYAEKFIKWMLEKVQKFLDYGDKIYNWLSSVVKKLGGFENAVRTLGIAIGAAVAIVKFPQIIASIKQITKLLKPTTLALIAIALIVEDFVQFMLGNDSVIGDLLADAGIDADDFREKVVTTAQNIKEIVTAVAQGFSSTIWPIIKGVFQLIGKALTVMAPLFEKIVGFMSQDPNTSGWSTFGEVLAAITTGIVAVTTAIKFATAAKKAWVAIQTVLNAVMSANPISLVIAGIAALIAIIILLVKHWDEVKEAVQGVWDKITGVFEGIGQWFTENVFDPITTGFQSVIDWITGLPEQALQWGSDIIQGIVDGITSGVQWVSDAVSGIGETISSFLHFSEPDEGPLSKFHTWMPDFMKGLAKDLDDNQDVVLDGVQKLAGGISTLMQSATATTAVGTSAARTVTQNVTFNNSYSGSANDVIKSIAATTKASAIDASTMMARSLALAR